MEQDKQRGMDDLVEHGHLCEHVLIGVYRDNGKTSNTDTYKNLARTRMTTMNECGSRSKRGVGDMIALEVRPFTT